MIKYEPVIYGSTVGSLRQQLTSSRTKEIVLGTLLGDGFLQSMKDGSVRLEIGHTLVQEDYVRWKYQELKKFVGAKPHLIKIYDQRYDKTYTQWRFKTKANSFFVPFYNYFYKGDKKIIRRNITQILNSPITLAVWFMDDGGRRNDSYGLFLNTLSFTFEEQQILVQCLKDNFSLESRIHWIQCGYRLYIPSKEAKKFCEIIYPHIVPSMKYKLSYDPVTTSFARLDRARDRGFKPL